MAEGKKTFIFYSDWINMVREMPNEDAGELLKHILSYVNDENPETKNILVKMAFGHMKPILKRDLDKWDRQLKKYSEMGKASANKRKKQPKPTQVEPMLTQVEPMNTVNDNVNVNVNDNVNDNKKKGVLDFTEIYPTFEDFWNEYDKKVGKKDKIKKKWDSLKQNQKEEIMDYLPNYKISQPKKQFRKNPETFLSNEGWMDELILPIEISKTEKRIERMHKDLNGW